eukprot:9413919-Alexandrium_andersonii.AAC.1
MRDIVARTSSGLQDPRKYMAACIRSRLAELDGGSPASTARSRTPVRSVHEPPIPPPDSAAKAAAAM